MSNPAIVSKLTWQLRRWGQEIWVPVTAYGILGVLSALGARYLAPFLPDGLADMVKAEAVNSLLHILANTMLTITTFSLSIMTAAYAFASQSATPRAFRLLRADSSAQRVLATFLGAFIFSLVGIIALQAGFYNGRGRLVLLVTTILVLFLIVANLIRWIEQLTRFGQMDDTLERVEVATRDALEQRLCWPFLGGLEAIAPPPDKALAVTSSRVAYVLHIDMNDLEAAAQSAGTDITLSVLPGSSVHPNSELAWIHTPPANSDDAQKLADTVASAITLGNQRDFNQDPRQGLIVLAQIASRALSPGINDPGTAIATLDRLTRVLARWPEVTAKEPQYRRVRVPPLAVGDVMGDAFASIGRDGAGMVEVSTRLLEALIALARLSPGIFGAAALTQGQRAMAHAEAKLTLPDDVAALKALFQTLRAAASQS